MLETVLVKILTERLEEGADNLTFAEAARIDLQIRDYLIISYSPWGRTPFEIANFICHSCDSVDAANRWLRSISEQERAGLTFIDVLQLIEPMKADEINELAEENEAEARGE
jgi:hypothetical protein